MNNIMIKTIINKNKQCAFVLNDVLKCGYSENKHNCYFSVPVINICLAKTDVQMAFLLFFFLIIQNTEDRAIRTLLRQEG